MKQSIEQSNGVMEDMKQFNYIHLPLYFPLWLMQDQKKYTGMIEDCCCDYETIDSINGEVLNPLLQELVTTSFFRYFKV